MAVSTASAPVFIGSARSKPAILQSFSRNGPSVVPWYAREVTATFSGTDKVYVAQDDRSVVVAFRGSESPTTLDGFKDWLLTNANNYLILPTGRAGTDFAAAGVGAHEVRTLLAAIAAGNRPMEIIVYEPVREWIVAHNDLRGQCDSQPVENPSPG